MRNQAIINNNRSKSLLSQDARIYVAGHSGLAGSALTRRLHECGYSNLIKRRHDELDLTDQRAVREFFMEVRPEYVFLAAARVGGIAANIANPAQFIRDNLAIQLNVIHEAWASGVKRLMFLGSSCIYPALCPQPMKEEHLLSGFLEASNESYALAKVAGVKMCMAYNREYGTDYVSVLPPNLYGPGDNYDPQSSHSLAALLRRFHEAKVENTGDVVVWGTGTPRREFMIADDMANACVFIAERFTANEIGGYVNVAAGSDVMIAELASVIARVVGYEGRFTLDPSKPDGPRQKLLDGTRLSNLGWSPSVPLEQGIETTYRAFLDPSRAR